MQKETKTYSSIEKAYLALSDLYVDNEVDYESIARQLQATELSWEVIRRIDQFEVFPILWSNLCAIPGGEWKGFDEEWLLAQIERNKKRNLFFKAKNWIWSVLFYNLMMGKEINKVFIHFKN